jgi:hypothetical protein
MDIKQVIFTQRLRWTELLAQTLQRSLTVDDPGIYDRIKNWKMRISIDL